MDTDIIFKDDNNMVLIKLLYAVDGYYTYEISISTLGFSGICNFCIIEEKLKEYFTMINCAIENLNGSFEINDCESDAYIKFCFEDSSNFYVSGQIGGSYQENVLNFKLKADQTLLLGLKRNLTN